VLLRTLLRHGRSTKGVGEESYLEGFRPIRQAAGLEALGVRCIFRCFMAASDAAIALNKNNAVDRNDAAAFKKKARSDNALA